MSRMRLFLKLFEAQTKGDGNGRSRWRCGLPIKNMTAHYNTQFCVS